MIESIEAQPGNMTLSLAMPPEVGADCAVLSGTGTQFNMELLPDTASSVTVFSQDDRLATDRVSGCVQEDYCCWVGAIIFKAR